MRKRLSDLLEQEASVLANLNAPKIGRALSNINEQLVRELEEDVLLLADWIDRQWETWCGR